MKQHPWDSFIEAVTGTLIAYAISVAAWTWMIGPIFHIKTSGSENVAIVGLFTVISLVRQFILRRIFNGKSPYAWIMQRVRKEPVE